MRMQGEEFYNKKSISLVPPTLKEDKEFYETELGKKVRKRIL